MQNIDLNKIIRSKALDKKVLATELFPGHKHPDLALSRILSGVGFLDEKQISKLSFYTSIPIAQLYTGAEWTSFIEGKKHVLACQEYRAELDTTTWIVKLYEHDSLFHEEVLTSAGIGLGEFIELLNGIIAKQK
jgi:hypothetical protein|tara:strand:- start:182 stop:583 length:402 start_codon:yes stop_codon:yes gene_type:complete